MTGQEIKALRLKLKLTQKELADKLGVARISVIRWESNKKRPSNMAKRLLRRLEAKGV